MGMKDPKQEPQSQLAPNLVSGPKDATGNDYANLVSMPNQAGAATLPGNLISNQGASDNSKSAGAAPEKYPG